MQPASQFFTWFRVHQFSSRFDYDSPEPAELVLVSRFDSKVKSTFLEFGDACQPGASHVFKGFTQISHSALRGEREVH